MLAHKKLPSPRIIIGPVPSGLRCLAAHGGPLYTQSSRKLREPVCELQL